MTIFSPPLGSKRVEHVLRRLVEFDRIGLASSVQAVCTGCEWVGPVREPGGAVEADWQKHYAEVKA